MRILNLLIAFVVVVVSMTIGFSLMLVLGDKKGKKAISKIQDKITEYQRRNKGL